jgi:predicted phage tail protein
LNAAGGAGPVAQHSWTVDTTAPVVQIQSFDPVDALTSRTSFSISFTSDAASVQCQLDNQAAIACQSPFIWNGLADGDHTVRITATDSAGNVSVAASRSWRVQSAPLAITSISVQQLTRNSATIRWSTNFPARGRVEYGINFSVGTPMTSTEATSQSITLSGLTPDTIYRFHILVVDRDGRSAVSAPISFTTLR